MTEREREIFQLIEKDPMISQAEIAKRLNIARASVGVHISNLVKKGYIVGKGYVIAKSQAITVIGGANVDIQGRPDGKLMMEDSNPGIIRTSLGGVGRNIAENLRMLNMDTRLITAVGDDKEGTMVRENARERGIDIDDSLLSAGSRTSSYLYVVDEHGEMIVAVSDMAIVNALTPVFMKKRLTKIERSPYTVLDSNLPQKTIEYLARNLKDTKLILDPVSVTKAIRANDVLAHFHAVKFNRMEAEAIVGYSLSDNRAIEKAGDDLFKRGIDTVVITLGDQGVYYKDSDSSFYRKAIASRVNNVTGAGDAFTAGIVYGLMHHLSPEKMVDFAMGAAAITIENENTIAETLSVSSVQSIIGDNEEEEE